MSLEEDNLELALVVEGIAAGYLELVEQLVIASDIDPTKLNQRVNDTGTVLHVAAQHAHGDILQFLLEHGADVNASNLDNVTSLHVAVQAGHVEATKTLLCRGASLNVHMRSMFGGDQGGATPLHIAADSGNVDMIRELLDHGAKINILDRWDFLTPLVFAARQGHERAVALLLSRGATPDGDCRASLSPLILAASKNFEAIVGLLLDKGADVNRRDGDGDPAIHSAAFCGHENIVRLLLEKCANRIDLIGGSGRPSWRFADKKGYEKIKSILEQRFREQEPEDGKSETQADPYPPDLIDDSETPFQSFPDETLVRDIEKAQEFIYCVMDSKDSWKERLRFVIPAPAGARGEYDIELIEPYRKDETAQAHQQDEEPDEPYMAISYCWGTHAVDTYKPLRIKIPGKDRGSFTIRETLARPEILHRSLALAKAKGIHRIWIDQECIHQHDPDDKRALIGVMHHIYYEAAIVLVILGRHIQSAEDIRGLVDIYDASESEELRDRILGDRWFRRAWTAQEYLNATKAELVYLVGWESDFDSSGELWNEAAVTAAENRKFPKQTVSREWELDRQTMFDISFVKIGSRNAMTEAIIQSQTGLGDNFTLCSPDLDEMSWWQTGNHKGISHAQLAHQGLTGHDHHHMAMISAFTILEGKRNLLTSDRLGILANLTRYLFHLDMDQVLRKDDNQRRLSFTACIIALALYNGDLSTILDRPFPPPTNAHSNLPTWLPPADMSFDSLIRPRFIPMNIFRGKTKNSDNPSFVVNGKLLTRGTLWEIMPFTGLLTLRDEARTVISICQQVPSKQKEELGLSLLKRVVQRLVECNQTDLLELVLAVTRSDQLSSPAELVSTVNVVKEWVAAEWPAQVTVSIGSSRGGGNNGMAVLRLPLPEASENDTPGKETLNPPRFADPEDGLVEQIPSEWGKDILRWIFYTIYVGAPLPVGHCCTGDSPLLGIFKVHGLQIKKALVPTSELNYEFGSSSMLWALTRELFWCVSETGDEASDEDLKAASRRLAAAKNEHCCVSTKILKNTRSMGIAAVWSPRLSSRGVLKQTNGSQP